MKLFLRQRTQPTTTWFLKATIDGIFAAYMYGCVASSTGLMILYGESSQPNSIFKNFDKSLKAGNGNVWHPVVGIPKHDTYPRLR